MGNDHVCQMVGIGTFGSRYLMGVIKELTEVRYVSQMKKNLSSVGAMKSK